MAPAQGRPPSAALRWLMSTTSSPRRTGQIIRGGRDTAATDAPRSAGATRGHHYVKEPIGGGTPRCTNQFRAAAVALEP